MNPPRLQPHPPPRGGLLEPRAPFKVVFYSFLRWVLWVGTTLTVGLFRSSALSAPLLGFQPMDAFLSLQPCSAQQTAGYLPHASDIVSLELGASRVTDPGRPAPSDSGFPSAGDLTSDRALSRWFELNSLHILSRDWHGGWTSVEAVSILNAMFPSGSFVSFREFLSQDQVQGRSLDDLARSLSGDPQSICFYGYFSLSTSVCNFSSSPSLPKCIWSRGSSWVKFSSYTLLLEWLKSFLTFLEALLPTESAPRSSAFHVLCLFQVCDFPLTGQAICWEHPVQQFPKASELERGRIYKCCTYLSDQIFWNNYWGSQRKRILRSVSGSILDMMWAQNYKGASMWKSSKGQVLMPVKTAAGRIFSIPLVQWHSGGDFLPPGDIKHPETFLRLEVANDSSVQRPGKLLNISGWITNSTSSPPNKELSGPKYQ